MNSHKSRGSKKAAFASLISASAALGLVAALTAPAQAATTVQQFNPFDANNGFTVVSQGNAVLGNGEIEGSIAVTGSISSSKSSAFPVRHVAAGLPDYSVPTVDGTPVRVLAGSFTGTGSFDHTNEGAVAGTPEAKAIAKFVSTDNLTASERGNFTRLRNEVSADENGVYDVKAMPWSNQAAALAAVKTVAPSVETYLGDVTAHIASTNSCLSALYTDAALHNDVVVEDQGGMAIPSKFATDRPNVVNYLELAGKTIKADRVGGWVPTPQAPLIIKVPAGVTTIGKVTFEGWNASAGANQTYARSILLDLSSTTGPITIDGFELGSIWAPGIDVKFASDVTTNGQWFAGNVETSAAGEIHHHTFLGQLNCVIDDEDGSGSDGSGSDGSGSDGSGSDGPGSDGSGSDGSGSDGSGSDGSGSDGSGSEGGSTDAGNIGTAGTGSEGTNGSGTGGNSNTGNSNGQATQGATDEDSDGLAQTGFFAQSTAYLAALLLLAGVGSLVVARKAAKN